MLTGKLKIQLAFHPATGISRKNIPCSPVEIPTIPSTQATIKKSLEQIQLDALMADIRETASGIRRLVNNPETTALLTNLNVALVRLDGTLAEIDRFLQESGATLQAVAGDTQPLLRKASHSLDKLDGTLTNATQLIISLEKRSGPVLESLVETTDRLNTILDEQSPIRMATVESLEELQRTLRSLANLTDYLQRHPEALMHGTK
jgi:paraquat-inducible protein B